MAKRTKKLSKKSLKLEALEQRQLLAGIVGGGEEVLTDIVHPNGNVYDQVLMTGASVAVTADAGQVTRISFLDEQGDIVQAEFSGAGTLTIALDNAVTNVDPSNYLQTGVKYVQGLASFTIQGSDASTNFQVFSVGKGNAVNQALFDDTHQGGNHTAEVARITVVADPSNPNGSIFGGIRAANAIFTAESGVVGITAANVQIQNVVRIGDLDAKGSATPALVFGQNSQFGSVDIAGGDLVQTNGKSVNNSGSYGYQIGSIANVDSAGTAIPAQTISGVTFTDQNPFPAPKSYDLTAAIDTIVGSSGDDVINGSHTSTTLVVSALDKIDGGAGNDLLNINDSNGGTAQLSGLTVTNVETFLYTSTGTLGSTGSVDTTGWTGLTSATVTLQNIAAGAETFKASKATDVTINSTSNATPGLWTIEGGKTVVLTNAGATGTGGATINGVDGTTSVTVTQTTTAGALGAVTVKDYATGNDNKTKAGTISTVSINGAVGATVNSNALSSLSLTKVTGAVTLTDELAGHATAGSGTTLALNLNESTLASLDQTTATVKQIDITTSGKKSSIGGYTNAGEVTTITVAGDQALDLGDISGLGKLATLTGSGTAGVTATVNAEKVAVTGGDGKDVITLSGQVKKAVDLGGGDDWVSATLNTTDHKTLDAAGSLAGGAGTDTLALSGQDAVAASSGTAFADQISGFEKLEITGGNSGTVDLHNLDDINQVILSGNFGGAYTLDKLASGASLTITATQAGDGTINVPVSAVQTESLAVTLAASGNVDAKTLITGNINTVNLTVTDTDTGAADAMDTVNFTQAKTVNIAGKVAQLTSNTAGATVDANGLEGKLVLTTTAADGTAIKGTTKASNDITATGAGKITITTGNSADTIAVAAGTTISAGNGANVITASGAGNNITTGSGGDSITVTATSGTTTIAAGDGSDTITVAGAAVSNITLGGGDDTVVLSSVAGTAGYFTTIIGAGNNDVINFSAVDEGTATFVSAPVTLGQGATFSDYVAQAASGNGDGNSIVQWFNFGGDTYLVVDNADGAYDAAGDVVVRLTGTLNLDTTGNGGTNAAIVAGVLTI